jgi:hypothetical protein
MFIDFGRGPPRPKKVVSNTSTNFFKCLLDPRDIHSAHVGISSIDFWNSMGNLIFIFFKRWLITCFWKALAKGFPTIYYTLNLEKNSMSCAQMKDID